MDINLFIKHKIINGLFKDCSVKLSAIDPVVLNKKLEM